MKMIFRTVQIPCKHEDLSLNPYNPHKKLGVEAWFCNVRNGERGGKYSGVNVTRKEQLRPSWNKQCYKDNLSYTLDLDWPLKGPFVKQSNETIASGRDFPRWGLLGGSWGHTLEGASGSSCLPLHCCISYPWREWFFSIATALCALEPKSNVPTWWAHEHRMYWCHWKGKMGVPHISLWRLSWFIQNKTSEPAKLFWRFLTWIPVFLMLG